MNICICVCTKCMNLLSLRSRVKEMGKVQTLALKLLVASSQHGTGSAARRKVEACCTPQEIVDHLAEKTDAAFFEKLRHEWRQLHLLGGAQHASKGARGNERALPLWGL